MTKRVQKFQDPRRRRGQRNRGRDDGEPIVHRRHQFGGDYKSNWERYEKGREALRELRTPEGGGYQVTASGESDRGYWEQGFLNIFCPHPVSDRYGRIFQLEAPEGTYQLGFIHTERMTLWQWDAPPTDCSIAGKPLTPIATSDPASGLVVFEYKVQGNPYFSISDTVIYASQWQYARFLNLSDRRFLLEVL